MRDAGFSTTSLGISARVVLAVWGGVLVNGNGGGNPSGTLPANVPGGKETLLVAPGTDGSIPAARNLSSRELGSATGVEEEV